MSNEDLEQANKLKKLIIVLVGRLEEIKQFQYENNQNRSTVKFVTIHSSNENYRFKRSIILPVEYFTIDFKSIKEQIQKEIQLTEELLRKL